jgi:predicted ATPase/signal transduction histidine kinase/CheY-like chemotaxis protein
MYSKYHSLTKIYESINSIVYRGNRIEDDKPIILKILKQDYPTPDELTRYRQEYDITRRLSHLNAVIKVYDIEKYQNTLMMCLEDFGGKSLDSIDIPIAIKITEILAQIHQQNIIHKDINPSNIVYNSSSKILKIIDFGISTLLPRQHFSLKKPEVLEGTLAYMSPEQTGRMNRALDYRSDFYSLGVTFYQLFTGRLPFEADDAMELVHCHLAKQPVFPDDLPPMLSKIIMKLMAKTAEERYQSAWGIKADLEQVLKNNDDFTLGQFDVSERFQISQKLYGRENEIQILVDSFEKVSQGDKQMMLIAGYSGIGKSVLVKELYKLNKHGYFISGKFDQFQRNIPYSALVSTFSDLVKQLLMETDAQLEQWKQKLLAAVGTNGQIIIDVIPEVELIIGKQAAVPELASQEAQNRFNLVFKNFISVFCQAKHPLVLFLDDLQWVDSATLQLVKTIITDNDIGYLFLIGAYRDNEVSPTHPLMITLDGLNHNKIKLLPLAFKDLSKMLSDTLHCDEQAVKSLVKLLIKKTQGNPFFINQLLQNLYEENLLQFVPQQGWQWDIEHIHQVDITDNVVELMIHKLQKFPVTTQNILSLAACVGNSFDLEILSIISEKPDCYQELLLVLKEGLILETDIFIFAHDRVQQAAYSLITETNKASIHLKIGRLLLTNTNIADNNFELVNHLNAGISLITDKIELQKLAELNLIAAQKAKDTAAYNAAEKYVIAGIECLSADSWESNYQISFDLYKLRAELEYLNGNFEQSENWINLILKQAKSTSERVTIYGLLIIQLSMRTKYAEAMQVGLNTLNLLGIDLVTENLEIEFKKELLKVKANLGNELVEISNPEKKLAHELLSNLQPLAFMTNRPLFHVMVLKAVNLSLNYGYSAESAQSYAWYSYILGSVLQEYKASYEFGILSLKLADKFNNLTQKCKAFDVFSNFASVWVQDLKLTNDLNSIAYQAALESGELAFAGYNLVHQLFNGFYQGVPLEDLIKKSHDLISFTDKIGNQYASDALLGAQLAILNLVGMTNEDMNEKQYLARYSNQNFYALCRYQVIKAQVLYLGEHFNEALECILEAEKIQAFIIGTISLAEYNFYYSLCLTALYPKVSTSKQQEYWQQLQTNQKQMKIWADNCPENFLHKYLLVQAEIAKISSQNAMDLYDQAIDATNNQSNKALANELAAKFWFFLGKEKFAKIYIQEAYYAYKQWGAVVKVEDLEKKFPELIKVNSKQDDTKTTITSSNILDLSSIMKASQTLSEEIVFSRLLKKMMHIVIENAGAETGFLLLPKQDQWFIQTSEQSIPIEDSKLPLDLINYVIRTQEYIVKQSPKSILCLPLLNQNKLTGILYLENQLIKGAFTAERLEVLKMLSAQLAISIENSLSYENLEQKVADRTVELKKANEAKSEFLSNMSHELRTPLNGILGYAQILKRAKNLEDTQVSGLKTIYNSGNHLLTLINDILDLSKIEARKLELYPENINFASFIDSITEIIGMRAEQKNVCFAYETLGDLPQGVEIDEKRLRQVLLNLLGNAIKFTDKGQVTLRISAIEETFRFEVKDTGVGMTDEELEKIFQPFEQVGDTQKRAEGTGLGLAISRQLVELMGSEIKIKSEFGKGSTFFFDLKLKAVEVEEKIEQRRIISYKDEKKTLLIVDDYPENRLILRQMLENIGFEVIEANDGKQGVELANKANIIFMDLVMPVMNGFEAVEIIRKDFKELPIIAISANVFEADKQKSLQAGCNAFLPKPIEEQKLFNALIEHLNLEWVYEEEQIIEAETLIPPPTKDLKKLYELAMMGDMREIKDFANQLDEQYTVFSGKLIELANGFEDELILNLVEEYM